jgi:diguanylate cyclase (GGDEF)-like protein
LDVTSAAAHRRTLLVSLAVLAYATVFAVFAVFERPGLGIGHFYYLAIVLLALAAGPRAGIIGGVVATGLFALDMRLNPHVPSAVEWESTVLRLVTYVGIGWVVGWYCASKQTLVAELERLARRDELTGLPNTRSFETAIERRFADARPFALLLGDVDSLGAINGRAGREGGDEALRRLADLLAQAKRPQDEVARVGGDEFAILAPCDGEDGRALATRAERIVAAAGATITFGWASYPREGTNALALYRAADERLYARKLARGYRRGSVQLAVTEDGRDVGR